MSKQISHHETQALLAAFADGELTDDQAADLCAYVSGHPDCVKRVLHEQRLRRACAKAMSAEPRCCPDQLRRELDAMLTGENAPVRPDRSASGRVPVLARLGRWLPAAVAAVLLLGAVGVYLAADSSSEPADGGAVLPASQVQAFETRHVRCSVGEAPMLKGELFPASLDEIDPVLSRLVDASVAGASLDLSDAGFAYALAGVCPVPGDDAVHLIYTAVEPDHAGRHAALSLWVQHDPDRADLEPGVPYVAADADRPHPMVVWREHDTVFYLVGDTMRDVERARPLVHLAAAP